MNSNGNQLPTLEYKEAIFRCWYCTRRFKVPYTHELPPFLELRCPFCDRKVSISDLVKEEFNPSRRVQI